MTLDDQNQDIDEGRVYVIPLEEEYSEISLKQHLIQNQTSTGDIKDMEAIKPMGTHILNKDVKDVVLEDCQNQDKWMDIKGDSIAIRMNSSSIKIVKCNNFGSNFILKHYKKIHDFSLLTPKLLAVIDKDNILTLYLKLDKPKEVPSLDETLSPQKQNSHEEK